MDFPGEIEQGAPALIEQGYATLDGVVLTLTTKGQERARSRTFMVWCIGADGCPEAAHYHCAHTTAHAARLHVLKHHSDRLVRSLARGWTSSSIGDDHNELVFRVVVCGAHGGNVRVERVTVSVHCGNAALHDAKGPQAHAQDHSDPLASKDLVGRPGVAQGGAIE